MTSSRALYLDSQWEEHKRSFSSRMYVVIWECDFFSVLWHLQSGCSHSFVPWTKVARLPLGALHIFTPNVSKAWEPAAEKLARWTQLTRWVHHKLATASLVHSSSGANAIQSDCWKLNDQPQWKCELMQMRLKSGQNEQSCHVIIPPLRMRQHWPFTERVLCEIHLTPNKNSSAFTYVHFRQITDTQENIQKRYLNRNNQILFSFFVFFFPIRTNHIGDRALNKAISMHSLEPSWVTQTSWSSRLLSNRMCDEPQLRSPLISCI